MIHNYHVILIGQVAFIHNEGWRTITGKVSSKEGSLSNFIPSGTIFSVILRRSMT
jgi:hypothetical protein